MIKKVLVAERLHRKENPKVHRSSVHRVAAETIVSVEMTEAHQVAEEGISNVVVAAEEVIVITGDRIMYRIVKLTKKKYRKRSTRHKQNWQALPAGEEV